MRPKRGFTLVEMLVATALIIFILVILTQAFVTGMDSFRTLKAFGDLEEKLRLATTVLRSDLAADHFEGKKRLSDSNFWDHGPPREGFFRIWQGSPVYNDPKNPPPNPPPPGTAYYYEGKDGDGLASFVATDHCLHFTVKRRGNRREEFATARVPKGSPLLGLLPNLGTPDSRFQDVPDTFSSQWYEVAYFLRATGQTTDGNIPRFALYRRQRLIVPETAALNDPQGTPVKYNPSNLPGLDRDYPEVSGQQNLRSTNWLFFNTPNTITVPQRRFGMDPNLPGGRPIHQPSANIQTWTYPTLAEENPALAGSDILLTDVLSFQVQILPFRGGFTTFSDIPLGSNPFFNDFSHPKNPKVRVFDTWSALQDEWSNAPQDIWDYSTWSASSIFDPGPPPKSTPNNNVIPMSFELIYAVKITLRVWDLKTRQTRQISVVQDM
jgi:prepilin-type N-terminal cleavage/methylation domain-containing protein